MRLSRGGRLVLAIGLILLVFAIIGWARGQALHLTEGEAFLAFWPAWLVAALLAFIAGWLLGRH